MTDSPLLLLGLFLGGLYFAKLWFDDFRATRAGKPPPHPLPGATPCGRQPVIIAIVGAIIIVAAETAGEIGLGISDEQSEMTVLFGCYTLVAALIEEVIFRGYIIIEKRGAALQWTGVVAASLLFAGLHDFLWQWDNGRLQLTLDLKGAFSTAAVFVSSLWFYTVRLMSSNPTRSLLPCFAAHLTKNLGVFGIKGAQGFIVGWW